MELKHDYEKITLDCCCLDCENSVLSLKKGEIRVNCPYQDEEHDYEGICQKHE